MGANIRQNALTKSLRRPTLRTRQLLQEFIPRMRSILRCELPTRCLPPGGRMALMLLEARRVLWSSRQRRSQRQHRQPGTVRRYTLLTLRKRG